MTIKITGPADGHVLKAGPMTIRVLEDGSSTGHRLGIAEITIPPHADGPPQHVHHQHDETFYVLSGTATFTPAARASRPSRGAGHRVDRHPAHPAAVGQATARHATDRVAPHPYHQSEGRAGQCKRSWSRAGLAY